MYCGRENKEDARAVSSLSHVAVKQASPKKKSCAEKAGVLRCMDPAMGKRRIKERGDVPHPESNSMQ
jgi:hypothetical protein